MPLAQSTGTDPDLIFQLVQYGVLGLVILGALFGWIWFKPAVERLLKDKERAENQIDDLVKVYEDKVIPTLTEANHVLSRLAEERRRMEDGGYPGRRGM